MILTTGQDFLYFLYENEKTITGIIWKLNLKYIKIKYKNNRIKLVWVDVSEQQFSPQSDHAWTKFTKKCDTDKLYFYYDDLCRMGIYDKTTHTLLLNLNKLSETGKLDDILHDSGKTIDELLDMLNNKYDQIDDINFYWFYE